MSRRGYVPHYARGDANQGDAEKDFRSLGCSVADLSKVGFGCSDLLIGCAGVDQLVEVKTEDGELEASQQAFNARWRGNPPMIYRTLDDAIRIVADMRRRARWRTWPTSSSSRTADCPHCQGFLFEGVVLHESKCPVQIRQSKRGVSNAD
jgi:hypothetical protein